MRALRFAFIVLLLGISGFFSYQLYQQQKLNQELKSDLIELSDIKYGLFNADEWKSVFAKVIAGKIADFNLESTNEQEIKKEISSFLNTAIDGFEKRYNKENETSGFAGLLKKSISSFAGIFDQVKKDIPVFTDQIYDFLMKGGNQTMMQQYIVKQLDAYTKDNSFTTDYSVMNSIIQKYKASNKANAKTVITEKLVENNSSASIYKNGLFITFVLMILLLLFLVEKTALELLLFILYTLILLGLGVLLPMIAIDARITSLDFSFLGETISFTDQVLFYKSKSITEVVTLLFNQERADLLIVGGLILLFSILFPVSKLIGSVFYAFKQTLQSNRFVQFLVFKTGKWSMADVFVIALFMAYLGLDGLLSEQLMQLDAVANSIKVITTNHSELLFGFYAFTAFAVFSLLVSQILQKKSS